MRCLSATVIGASLSGAPQIAEAQAACRFFCTPELLVEPTVTFENVAKRTRVRTPGGEEITERRAAVFETILAVDIPTRLSRLGFTAEAIVVPFTNDNGVELELETNVTVITSEQTRGWVSSHIDIVDKFSPAERPSDRRAYTHKLNFEWDTAVAPFNRLPNGRWWREVEVEASLDFVATGLPRAGDMIDGRVLVTNASPWSFSLVLVLPVTP